MRTRPRDPATSCGPRPAGRWAYPRPGPPACPVRTPAGPVPRCPPWTGGTQPTPMAPPDREATRPSAEASASPPFRPCWTATSGTTHTEPGISSLRYALKYGPRTGIDPAGWRAAAGDAGLPGDGDAPDGRRAGGHGGQDGAGSGQADPRACRSAAGGRHVPDRDRGPHGDLSVRGGPAGGGAGGRAGTR